MSNGYQMVTYIRFCRIVLTFSKLNIRKNVLNALLKLKQHIRRNLNILAKGPRLWSNHACILSYSYLT